MDIIKIQAEFLQNGFCVVNNVFASNEINEMMKAFECGPIQQHFKSNPTGFGFHLLEITTMHPIFLKYARHPKIIEIIKPILGENIQLQHSKSTVKMPGISNNRISWHQDFAYLPHTNTSLLTVMICLVDFSSENGCMQAVMGSHKFGILNHRNEKGEECLEGCTDNWAWEHPNQVANITPRQGGISIHHCLTLHSSGDNISKLPRYSIAFTYRTSDAYQLADDVWKDTGLIVSGSTMSCVNVRLEAFTAPLIRNPHRYPESHFGNAYHQIGKHIKRD